MKFPWIMFQRYPHQSALPAITEDQRGMVRMLTGDGSTTDDELHFGAYDAGTLEWRKFAMVEDVASYYITVGPFYINDLPGTATTQATTQFFDTGTTVLRSGNDRHMSLPGVVVGMWLNSDSSRTAGTATARLRLTGVGTAFNGGACVLDATNTFAVSSIVAAASGVAFAANTRIGAEVVTSGWTPITANLVVWLLVRLDYF